MHKSITRNIFKILLLNLKYPYRPNIFNTITIINNESSIEDTNDTKKKFKK